MRRIVTVAPFVLILGTLMFLFVLPARASAVMYDLNGDGKINIKDTVVVAKAFGAHQGDPRWDLKADLNGDNVVDLADLFIISKHFGEPRVLVVPEYWIGTVLGLTGCFAALGLFFATKRRHL
jgi:hypothetical protein